MSITFIFCSLINVIDWLQNHLIPCPFKALTGIDCPGCGFQRSVIALLQGDFSKSWHHYPPTIPLLILFVTAGITYRFPIKNNSFIMMMLIIAVGNFVLISYLVKILALVKH
ncbi:DUF2752 domain-containing protein [Pedobacter sp. G11]|uniref:DUF2752 domain-containing protein n=1 Tax=Pedobacter sp. G11 TaxID=2482728 RepID=UPI000F603D25|nr:DUF2752 domain-containing protein [Pedobacter sp. G11]AZI25236.1 DUF2752 domain-containing protein [Pedobacter sp. G11]